MKKAFTLAETLISITIIALIAAIAAPAISSARPDESKTMYLKAYDSLSVAVQSLATNSELYPNLYDDGNGNYYNVSAFPFMNENVGNNSNFPAPKYSGDVKFANLLIDAINGTDSTYDPSTGRQEIQFKTNGGKFVWEVRPSCYSFDASNVSWSSVVTVDIEGNTPPDNIYVPNIYENKPTAFQFCISASGNVIPADVYGQMYLEDRQYLKKRKNEKEILLQGIKNKKYTDLTKLGSGGLVTDDIQTSISSIEYEY